MYIARAYFLVALLTVLVAGSFLVSGRGAYAEPASSANIDPLATLEKLRAMDPDLLETIFRELASHPALSPAERQKIEQSSQRFLAALRGSRIRDLTCARSFVAELTGGTLAHLLILRSLGPLSEKGGLSKETREQIRFETARASEGLRRGAISNESLREIFGRKEKPDDQVLTSIKDELRALSDKAGVEASSFDVDIGAAVETAADRCLK